jgi:fibronectin type 3 domain-containing protein
VRVPMNGHLLELASPLSEPVSTFAANVFPPSVPRELAAVATAGENGNPPAIDLSWLPDTDADLAGYIVYRRESSGTDWQRVSHAQPVVGPGFRDANVQPGHIYIYAVSAIGQNGHESARSAETQETVPAR